MEEHFNIPFDYLMDFYFNAGEILQANAGGDTSKVLTSVTARSPLANKNYTMTAQVGGLSFLLDSKNNPYINFSTTNGYGVISNINNYTSYNSNNFTMYMIVKNANGSSPKIQNGFFIVDSAGYLNSNGGYAVSSSQGGVASLNPSSSSQAYPGGVNPYDWRVIIGVFRPNKLELWSNGALIMSSSGTIPIVSIADKFCINRRSTSNVSNTAYTADIMEVALLTEALSNSDIITLFNQLKEKYKLTSY